MTDTTYADTTPQNRHTLRKGILLTLLLVAAFLIIVGLGAARMMNNDVVPTRSSNNETNPGTTRQTDAPTTDTNTPRDRTVPSQSGGEANTILQP